MRHDETALVPYLRGEVPDAERREVETHLASCAACRGVADDFRAVLAELAARAPAPPAVHWGRYQAELREKLDLRRGRAAGTRRWWPATLALSGTLAAVLLFFVVHDAGRRPHVAELGAVEEAVIGGRLELLRQYSVVERLDLLEDLEVIRHLDRLEPVKEG